jgi:hypothetical protein
MFFGGNEMRKIITLWALCFLASGMIFAQNSNNQYAAAINGRWKNDREGLTFQFNPDGTFIMAEESEEARRAAQGEQRANNERVTTSVNGTYTVTATAVNMVMVVDGKSHRIRMSYKIIDIDTLQMERQNYRRVKL